MVSPRSITFSRSGMPNRPGRTWPLLMALPLATKAASGRSTGKRGEFGELIVSAQLGGRKLVEIDGDEIILGHDANRRVKD